MKRLLFTVLLLLLGFANTLNSQDIAHNPYRNRGFNNWDHSGEEYQGINRRNDVKPPTINDMYGWAIDDVYKCLFKKDSSCFYKKFNSFLNFRSENSRYDSSPIGYNSNSLPIENDKVKIITLASLNGTLFNLIEDYKNSNNDKEKVKIAVVIDETRKLLSESKQGDNISTNAYKSVDYTTILNAFDEYIADPDLTINQQTDNKKNKSDNDISSCYENLYQRNFSKFIKNLRNIEENNQDVEALINWAIINGTFDRGIEEAQKTSDKNRYPQKIDNILYFQERFMKYFELNKRYTSRKSFFLYPLLVSELNEKLALLAMKD